MKRMMTSDNEKNSKQCRSSHETRDEDSSAKTGPLKSLVDAMVKCSDEMRVKIVERKAELDKKKQRMQKLKGEYECLKNDRAEYREKLQNQQKALDGKKQELNTFQKMAPEYVKNAKAVVKQKVELGQHVNTEVSNIARLVTEYKVLSSRAKMAAERCSKWQDGVKTTLEYARKQLTITNEEFERSITDHQAAIGERRRQWNELNSQIQEKRRVSEETRTGIRQIEDEIEAIHTKMSEDERQRTEMIEKTMDLENRLSTEECFAADTERLKALKIDLASSKSELNTGTDDLCSKLNDARAEMQATETELDNDGKLLAELKAGEEKDEASHLEKIRAMKVCLQERMQALTSFQEETKIAQEKRNAERKENEKQHQERLEQQRVRLEELKKHFESISDMKVISDSFRIDCREVTEFKQKLQEKRESLTAAIEETKHYAEEIVLEDEKQMSPKKSPIVTRTATERKEDNLTEARGSVKGANKHVTFKRTPVLYKPDARHEMLQDPKPPVVPLTKPVLPKTPSPKKHFGPPAKPQSARPPNRVPSQWSDSSEDSIVCVPPTHALLRKPITKRTTQGPPNHLGIF